MGLRTEILVKALRDFQAQKGHGAWSYLKRGSKVDNLGRIAEGKIIPQLKTWEKLHHAFPDIIPEPVFEGVIVVSPTIQAASVKNGNAIQVNGAGNIVLSGFSQDEQEIINLLRLYGNRALVNRIKKMLYDVKKASE